MPVPRPAGGYGDSRALSRLFLGTHRATPDAVTRNPLRSPQPAYAAPCVLFKSRIIQRIQQTSRRRDLHRPLAQALRAHDSVVGFEITLRAIFWQLEMLTSGHPGSPREFLTG